MLPVRIILASRSPRRLSLLREAGFEVLPVDPPFADPPAPGHGPAAEQAQQLALAKAASVFHDPRRRGGWRPADRILAADTIVVAPDGTLLGQPRDRDDARRMLDALLGARHEVVTGVCLIDPASGESHAFADRAEVLFGKARSKVIERYLASGAWLGKAGAYNLAEIHDAWSAHVLGDPDTVVGLPMRRLLPLLGAGPRQPA